MAANAKEFAEKIESARAEKWGYIWGTAGETWTQAKQDSLKRKYDSDPGKYANYAKSAEYGNKWVGRKVADCSGLPYRKLREMGVKIHHGSNSIWRDNLRHKGKITKGLKLPIGAAIFTGSETDKPHIGTLTADGVVTEAKGASAGVVDTPLSNKKWTYWGLYKGVEYDFVPGEEHIPNSTELESDVAMGQIGKVTATIKFRTLRKGDKGDDVKTLQKYLITNGEQLPKYDVDGKFGYETLRAVKNFQRKHDLVVDGIVGPKTWKELLHDGA